MTDKKTGYVARIRYWFAVSMLAIYFYSTFYHSMTGRSVMSVFVGGPTIEVTIGLPVPLTEEEWNELSDEEFQKMFAEEMLGESQ